MKSISVACMITLLLCIGCKSEADKETFQGKTGTDWIRVSRDRDPATRIMAIEPLAHLNSRQAMDAAKHLFADENLAVRHGALKALTTLQQKLSDDELLECLLKLTRATEYIPNGPQLGIDISVAPEFTAAVSRLGPKAKPLVPELNRLKGEIARLGYTDHITSHVVNWINGMLVTIKG